MKKTTLLKFPHPFKAALAVCSDIDGTSWENFLAIHQFLNSTAQTPLGKGVGLNISDSFWMFDQVGTPNAAFSYFKNDLGQPSEKAPMMRELMRADILDVMHGYGNFSEKLCFSRKMAEIALEELDKHKIKIRVWTNHGGEESEQNIGALSAGRGDLYPNEKPFNSEQCVYHADLLLKYGLRFYWDCERALTNVVGQNRKANFAEFYWKSPLYQTPVSKLKTLAKAGMFCARKKYAELIHPYFKQRPEFKLSNLLLQEDQLRDDRLTFRFKRFGNGRLDWSDDLPRLLNDRVLETLIEKQGYMVLYIHLGDRLPGADSAPLSEETVRTFRKIAELYQSGTLWVETVSRLLNYNYIYHHLDWYARETESQFIIHIKGLQEKNSKMTLSQESLCGISFKISMDKPVLLFFKNRSLDIQQFPIDQNYQIIMIPRTNIEWPL